MPCASWALTANAPSVSATGCRPFLRKALAVDARSATRMKSAATSGRGRNGKPTPCSRWPSFQREASAMGALPVWLHAEHGFWSRPRGARDWVPAAEVGGSWREPVLHILRDITARTPGSLIEVKAVAIAWHYRMADLETGARRANELRLHLNQLLSNQPVEILAEQDPAHVYRGKVLRRAAVFGARKLQSDDPSDRTDDRVVEVVVSADGAPFLVGQRVLVKFVKPTAQLAQR